MQIGWFRLILFGLILIFGVGMLHSASHSKQMPCNPESTGLKYVTVPGSGFASAFFFLPLVALAPLAGATDTTGQYRCHVSVIGRDALTAKWKRDKWRTRPKVDPY